MLELGSRSAFACLRPCDATKCCLFGVFLYEVEVLNAQRIRESDPCLCVVQRAIQ